MKLLRIEEVAVTLGTSFQAVRNAIASGDLAVVRVGDRGVHVREEGAEVPVSGGSR